MESANSQYEIWNLSAQVCNHCEDGEYDKCKCNEGVVGKIYQAIDDLSNDSLDCPRSPKPQSNFKTAGFYPHTFTGEYISDDEFQDGFVKEQSLPASSTDWETIDSVLDKEIVDDDKYDSDVDNDLCTSRHSSRLMYTPNNMQMCFVDSEDSDKESIADVEVYYEEEHLDEPSCLSHNYENERIASCDSGYVGGEILEYNIEHVTDIKPRKNSLEPVEASTRILTCLQIHEDHEMHQILEKDNSEKLSLAHTKNIDDLKHLKEELESRINEVNMQLVEELMLRDELYGYHEALLMDADDLNKSPQEDNNFISSTPKIDKQKHISEVSHNENTLLPHPKKTRFFWNS